MASKIEKPNIYISPTKSVAMIIYTQDHVPDQTNRRTKVGLILYIDSPRYNEFQRNYIKNNRTG